MTEAHGDYANVPKLIDSLLEILPGVLQSVALTRRHLKQDKFLKSLLTDLHIIRVENIHLSLEAVKELQLMCTVNAT